MLGDKNAIATIAVSDIARARKFYEGTIGMTLDDTTEPEALGYRSGNSPVLIYKSQYAGTNRATSLTWLVDDVDAVVRDLKAKGVAFEHYDLPGTTRRGDVHLTGKLKNAWFKDPDGNILALVSG
ncbi:MAG: VOC family protein [Gemmatimonadales bacterium]